MTSDLKTLFSITQIFQYGFSTNAFWACLMVGLVLPILGLDVTTKHLSMMGDALSHTALAGVAIGLLVGGISPTYMAVIISVLSSLLIELMRIKFKKYSEMTLAIIISASAGTAGLIQHFLPNANKIDSFLFGSILGVTTGDLLIIGVVTGLVVLLSILFYRTNMYVSYNPYEAKISGLKINYINIVTSVLTAAAIAVSSSIIGSLLVASLMIIPVAIALQLVGSYLWTLIVAVIFAEISSMGGFLISLEASTSSGSTIVVFATFLLVLVLAGKGIYKGFQILYIRKHVLEKDLPRQ